MNIELLIGIAVGFFGGGALAYLIWDRALKSKKQKLIEEARSEGDVLKKDKILQAKEKFLQLKAEHEKYINERSSTLAGLENKHKQQENTLNQRRDDLQRKTREFETTRKEVEAIRENLNSQLLRVESKNEVSYLMSKNARNVCQAYPMGAVTKNCKGEEFTEILDMHHAGAVAFTDGENPIWNTDILHKTLLYLQKIDGLLINRPEDKHLTAFGTMNEGITSTILGMKGMPGISEEVMVKRDIEILKYAGGRMHFSNISTALALKQIAQAKKEGLDVTCDVAAYNLLFEDTSVMDYDTNFKVNPPLRDKKDIRALVKGINSAEVDAIVSAHTPQDEESKKLEFDLADFGMLGLQTFLPMVLKVAGKDLEAVLDKFTTGPRKILRIPVPEIKEGEKAELTVFDPEKEWIYDEQSNLSKSVNSPWMGKKLKGGIVGVIGNGRSFFNDF